MPWIFIHQRISRSHLFSLRYSTFQQENRVVIWILEEISQFIIAGEVRGGRGLYFSLCFTLLTYSHFLLVHLFKWTACSVPLGRFTVWLTVSPSLAFLLRGSSCLIKMLRKKMRCGWNWIWLLCCAYSTGTDIHFLFLKHIELFVVVFAKRNCWIVYLSIVLCAILLLISLRFSRPFDYVLCQWDKDKSGFFLLRIASHLVLDNFPTIQRAIKG